MGEKIEVKVSAQAEVAARVLSAGVGSPQIITGNYSALMACVNNILTHTVTIAPDGLSPGSSPIHLIAEPMFLDSVHSDYYNELWGQSIDGFPPAIQKFAQDNIHPVPVIGNKLTWGQIRDLRSAMLARIKKTEGFTVYEGQISKVEERNKELKIQLVGKEGDQVVTIPLTGKPVVLDFSQRPRPAGPALMRDPTILYQYSREDNERFSDVPIFVTGAGAQTAWVLDKMGVKRDYSILYGTTLDFRIANAILGKQAFTATDANIKIENDIELKQALSKFSDKKPHEVTYTRDDGNSASINLSIYPNDGLKLMPADLISTETNDAKAYLMGLGLKEESVDSVLEQINEQLASHEGEGLSKKQLAINLMIDPPPVASVGFAVNATGWVALKDTVSKESIPFWGASADVTTGEELVKNANLVTPGSLLPGSGIPRALAMKNKLREMRGTAEPGIGYDVRALAFTEVEFKTMCENCGFSSEFASKLKKQINELGTPQDAVPNPVTWILNHYDTWLNIRHSIALSEVKDTKEVEVSGFSRTRTAEAIFLFYTVLTYPCTYMYTQLLRAFSSHATGSPASSERSPLEKARSELMKNVLQNEKAESSFVAGSDVIITDAILEPHILETQKQLKDGLNALKSVANRVMATFSTEHDDEALAKRRAI